MNTQERQVAISNYTNQYAFNWIAEPVQWLVSKYPIGVESLIKLANGHLLVGTSGGELWKSVDKGNTFYFVHQFKNDYDFNEDHCLVLLQLTDGTVLVGTTNGCQIWKSTDNGDTFTLMHKFVMDIGVKSLLQLADETILVGSEGVNYPKNNKDRDVSLGKIVKLTIKDDTLEFNFFHRMDISSTVNTLLQLNNGVVLAGVDSVKTGGQVLISTDNGNTFKCAQQFPELVGIRSLIQLADETVLLGTSDGQIWKLNASGYFYFVQELNDSISTFLQLDNGTILVGTDLVSEIWESTDNGKTFHFIKCFGGMWGGISVNSLVQLEDGTVLVGLDQRNQKHWWDDLCQLWKLVRK
jgi:hypothetical protein